MNIFKAIVCKAKGHVVDPEKDNIMVFQTIKCDSRNWICKCERCGAYIMNDGAGSGLRITLSKKQAYEIKNDYEKDMLAMINLKLENRV